MAASSSPPSSEASVLSEATLAASAWVKEIYLENDPFLPYVGPRCCHISGFNGEVSATFEATKSGCALIHINTGDHASVPMRCGRCRYLTN